MHGGGEEWVTAPWDWITGLILLGLAVLGARGFAADGGQEADGGGWG